MTFAERAWIEEKLNAHKKWIKPLKGKIVLKREGSSEEFVIKGSYSSEKDLIEDANGRVAHMNSIDKNGAWALASAVLVGTEDTSAADSEV